MFIAVRDIMTPNPITVQCSAMLVEVIGLMKAHKCRQLPVLEGHRLAGIVTDRDIRLAAHSSLVLREHSEDLTFWQNATAQDCMTYNPLTVEPNKPATHAAELLNRYKFGALPVVENGQLVGIVTVSDILSSYIALLAGQGSG